MVCNSYWKHVLNRDWQWVNIVKAPKVLSLPDILTVAETETIDRCDTQAALPGLSAGNLFDGLASRQRPWLIAGGGYRQVNAKQIHVRRGKGHKDRFVPLPDLTYQALRALWSKHRNPMLVIPQCRRFSLSVSKCATTHMDRGGAQTAMKAVVTQCGIKKKSRFTPFATVSLPICLNRA